MEALYIHNYKLISIRSLLMESVAIAFVVLAPAFSHLAGIPVYFIEPMRLFVVMSILLSHKANAYILAILLPLASYLVSGHPVPLKMMIIMAELSLNVWLFFALANKSGRPFMAMFLAIVGSKIFCYGLYLVFFSVQFVIEEASPVFLGIQLAVTLILSSIAFMILRKRPGN